MKEQETKGKYFTGQNLSTQVRQLDSATGKGAGWVDFFRRCPGAGEESSPMCRRLCGGTGKGGSNPGRQQRRFRPGQAGDRSSSPRRPTLPYAGSHGLPPGRLWPFLHDGTVAALTVQSGGKREVADPGPRPPRAGREALGDAPLAGNADLPRQRRVSCYTTRTVNTLLGLGAGGAGGPGACWRPMRPWSRGPAFSTATWPPGTCSRSS